MINETTTQSSTIFESAKRCIPGGVNSFSRSIVPHTVFSHGMGAYLFDVDGRRYLDYHAAFGPIVLGHCDPRVDRAVSATIGRLDLMGIGTTEVEVRVAEQVVQHIPSAEMVHFCNTGTEATYNAVRLARAVTGRMKLLKFQGCFHGSHDYLAMNIISPAERVGRSDPASAGILPAALANTLVAEFNNLSEVERVVKEHGRDLAAIILEPIPHNIGCVMPRPGFLEGLRKIATANSTVLIFDEVITGFRHGLGGYQKICGVMPDLTTLGKSIANGYPCAALCGRRDLMRRFNTADGDVLFAGTFNAHPVGMSAALATIEALEAEEVYKHTFRLGDKMRQGLSEIAARLHIPAVVAGFGSVFTVYFMDGPVSSYTDLLRNNSEFDAQFRKGLLEEGILMHPAALKRNHISASHTDQDIEMTLEKGETVLRRLTGAH